MIYFSDPRSAVLSALEMVETIPAAGLPSAHVGIDAGPVIQQDGDYFGRTVNVAARIAGRAGADQVLVSENVVAAVDEAGVRFAQMGLVELKGLPHPVELHQATRST